MDAVDDTAEAQAAAKRREERVLVPTVFRERITDGFGTYRYSYVHGLEDLHEYQKQIEMQKQDISMLELLKEGENEKEASGKVLVERFGARVRHEDKIKAALHKQMAKGKDLTPEHPADVFFKVSDPNAKSFQECWEITKHFQHKNFFDPGRQPLMDMLERSRTRRHFIRAIILLHKYDKKSLRWSNEDKIRVIRFSQKHRYTNFLNPKYKTNIATNFFDTQSILERYLAFLLHLRKSKLIETVETDIKEKFGRYSKDGYHYIIHGYYKAKAYEKVVSTFKELVLDSQIKSYSLSLWNHAAASIIKTKAFNGLSELVEKLKKPFIHKDGIIALQALCMLANEEIEGAKELLSTDQIRDYAKRVVGEWEGVKEFKDFAPALAEQYALVYEELVAPQEPEESPKTEEQD